MVHKVRCLGEPEDLAAYLVSMAERREAREVSARTTRQDRDLCVPRSRSDMGKRRFTCRGPMFYNILPSDLVDLAASPFPRQLKQHFLALSAAPER